MDGEEKIRREEPPKMPEARPGSQMYYDTLLQFFTPITPSTAKQKEIDTIRPVFREMCEWLLRVLPANPERTLCIRSLLTAKEAAVRAVLFKQ